ncbi:MAG: peptide chain release factor N(5)-glutamine methyltransferase [Bacteroidia bacterium]
MQKHFFSELSTFYSKNELNSIWNLCLDFIIKMNRTFFLANPEKEVEEEKKLKLEDAIRRLKKQEPIQYITGKSWFCDSEFIVNNSVLIPRPETEELVYKICETINNKALTILDIGTGSGCIAISIKKLKPKNTLVAVDISEEALNTATNNAFQILSDTSVSFINRDVLKPDFANFFKVKFDIIVSNPPYIPSVEKETIAKNVLNFEPHLALFCKINPLQFYRAIATQAKQLLNSGGLLFFEIHENFGDQVKELLIQENFTETEIIKDFQGKNRMIKTTYTA